MHSIQLRDIHAPKGPNLWLLSVLGVTGFGVCLITFLISLLGGDQFVESLGGNVTLAILVAGLFASAVCMAVTKPRE